MFHEEKKKSHMRVFFKGIVQLVVPNLKSSSNLTVSECFRNEILVLQTIEHNYLFASL